MELWSVIQNQTTDICILGAAMFEYHISPKLPFGRNNLVASIFMKLPEVNSEVSLPEFLRNSHRSFSA